MQLRPLPVCQSQPDNSHCRIYVLGDGKQWWAAKFLQESATNYKDDFEKLLALLDRCVRNGMPTNEQKVRKLEGYDGLFEFKAGCLRLFWFWDKGKVVICTHGIIKKAQETPKKDLNTADRRKKAYQTAKRKNEIKIHES